MDEDDVDPDELAPVPDRLGGDLADVRDELQLQVVRLRAAVARAQVGRDVLALEVERAVHGDGGLSRRGDRGVAVQRVGLTREEGRVALDLDQVEVRRRHRSPSRAAAAVFTSAWARLIRWARMYSV